MTTRLGPLVNDMVRTMHDVDYAAAKDGSLSQLDASFSQACDSSNAPPLVGFVRFNATQPTPIPVLPVPSWSQPGASPSP